MLIYGIADSDLADNDNNKTYKVKKTLVVSEDNNSEPLGINTARILASKKKKSSKKTKVSDVATCLYSTFADRILETMIVIPEDSSDVAIEEVTTTNAGWKAKKHDGHFYSICPNWHETETERVYGSGHAITAHEYMLNISDVKIRTFRCSPCTPVGLNTGMGKPTVNPKWVSQVWVQFWLLSHHDTPHTHATVLRVFTVSWYEHGLLVFQEK